MAKKTAPEPVRDPAGDHLLTPTNCVLELMRNWARESSDRFRTVLQWYFPERQRLGREA